MLASTLADRVEAGDCPALASALAKVAGSLEARESARLCHPVARALLAGLERILAAPADPSFGGGDVAWTASTLAAIAERLDEAESSGDSPGGDPGRRLAWPADLDDPAHYLATILPLVRWLVPQVARAVAREISALILARADASVTQVRRSMGRREPPPLGVLLPGLLVDDGRAARRRRDADLVGLGNVGLGGGRL